MKYRKILAGLEERRKLYDASSTQAKSATRRPGSLSSSAPGPSATRSKRR